MTEGSDPHPVVNVVDETGEKSNEFTCTYEDLHSLTKHKFNGNPLNEPYPPNTAIIFLGMGCFWGAERLFWETDGVFVTSVGFMGGHLDNPSYEDVCGGDSGHTETVKVVYHPDILSLKQIVHLFIDHSSVQSDIRFTKDEDETKKHRLQYASKVWCTSQEQFLEVQRCLIEQLNLETESADDELSTICSMALSDFYPAEDRHQQYMVGRMKKRKYQCPRI